MSQKQLTSEVDLFYSILQQNVNDYKLNCEYVSLATIKPNAAIKFTVNSKNKLYWANEYTLYAFTITDGPTGLNTYISRSKFAIKSARLEMPFAPLVNNNIKVILYYQMLYKIEFDQFHVVLLL